MVLDAAELESTMKENQNGISSNIIGHGMKADPLSTEMNGKDGHRSNKELEYSGVMGNFSNGNENVDRDSVAPSAVHMSPVESDLYSENNNMECDLPELIVCYKDSSCHAIKDICVDEGTPIDKKFLTESVDDCRSPTSNGYEHTDMTKELVNDTSLFQDGFRPSSCKDCSKDAANDCEIEEEVNIVLLIQRGQNSSSKYTDAIELKSSLKSKHDETSASLGGTQNVIQSGQDKCNAVEKTAESVSDSATLVELCKQTSLKFLLESSKSVDNDIQQSNQVSNHCFSFGSH